MEEEKAPAEPVVNPAAMVEEAPAPAPAKVEAAPATEERLAVESLALLESLRDWRRKEEELEQSIRAKQATPERPAMPVAEAFAVAPAVEAERSPAAAPSKITAILASVRSQKNFILIALAVALLVSAGVYLAVNKTKGPGNRSFPSPSGSTTAPSKEDPTPSLRLPRALSEISLPWPIPGIRAGSHRARDFWKNPSS